MDFSMGIALIICAVALLRLAEGRAKKGGLGKEQVEQFDRRIGEMEKRLTDIQEIVLAIDEKLERQESRERG